MLEDNFTGNDADGAIPPAPVGRPANQLPPEQALHGASWGWLRAIAGACLATSGLLLVLAAAVTVLARALPLTQLATRPGACWGAVLIVAGLLVAGAGRRRPQA